MHGLDHLSKAGCLCKTGGGGRVIATLMTGRGGGQGGFSNTGNILNFEEFVDIAA